MLNVVSSKEAVDKLKTLLENNKKTEILSLDDALDRILGADIVAAYDIPAFDRSTVDGYAVCASDTYGCNEAMPAILKINGKIPMGVPAECIVENGLCCEIATGAMLPQGADAVVMVEYTEEDDGDCLVMKAVSPLENITRKGDDIKKNTIVFEKGTRFSAIEIGIIASLGIAEVEVFKKLNIGILSTGDEIIPPGSDFKLGKIFDSNSYLVSSLFKKYGCETKFYGIIPDSFDAIKTAVEKAVFENDIVLLSGGSSAGTRDMTAEVISELGQLHIHGIAMKPGKPTVIGSAKEKTIVGLPGHPAAAFFVCETIIRPVVEHYYCEKDSTKKFECEVDCNISSNHGREEIIPVKICGNKAAPILAKSGILSNISNSDGYIRIERNLEGLKKSDKVIVTLF